MTKRYCTMLGCGKVLHSHGYCHTHLRRIIGEKRGCIVDGCGGKTDARGMCTKHYQRWKLYGTTELPVRKEKPLADRLREQLLITPNGCWEYQGNRNALGYGRLSINNVAMLAHRAAYGCFVGEVPAHLGVLHKCDNPPCCNPDHLFLGTQLDNNADMRNKGRGVAPPLHQGEEQHCAVLKKKDVLVIRDQLSQGVKGAALARHYKVSDSIISCIKTGKTWKSAA